MTGFQTISGGRRRSKYGIVEDTACISIADFRHALRHEEGRDRHWVRIQGGRATGLIVCIEWSQLRYGYRSWFLCPGCDKPSGRLYTGAKGWNCRPAPVCAIAARAISPRPVPLAQAARGGVKGFGKWWFSGRSGLFRFRKHSSCKRAFAAFHSLPVSLSARRTLTGCRLRRRLVTACTPAFPST